MIRRRKTLIAFLGILIVCALGVAAVAGVPHLIKARRDANAHDRIMERVSRNLQKAGGTCTYHGSHNRGN